MPAPPPPKLLACMAVLRQLLCLLFCVCACVAACLQVKGLTSRKTLGQWLDDRGVTAKPRLTLADQVQQHTVVAPSRSSRGGAAGGAAAAAAGLAAACGAVGSGDLSGAVGGVVRMGSGQRRSSAHDGWNCSTGGGAVVSRTGGDTNVCERERECVTLVAASCLLPGLRLRLIVCRLVKKQKAYLPMRGTLLTSAHCPMLCCAALCCAATAESWHQCW